MTIISHCYRQILLDRQIKKFDELCWQEKSQRYGKLTDTYLKLREFRIIFLYII